MRVTIFFSAILLVSLNVQAGMVKWVDDKGQVHYGDRIPTKYLKSQHEELNDQGVVIKKFEKKKSDEELAKEKAAKEKQAAVNREKMIEQRKKALRDRVLTQTFTTVKDIEIARDDRVNAVDTQIQLSQTLIKQNEAKLKKVKQRIKNIEASGRKVPENLHKEVNSVSRQIQTDYQYVEDKNQEKQEIIRKFDGDIQRFRELMAEKKQKE